MDKGKDILNLVFGFTLILLISLLVARSGFVTEKYGYLVYSPLLISLSFWVFNNIKNPPPNFYASIGFVLIPISLIEIFIFAVYFISPENFGATCLGLLFSIRLVRKIL